ncbi:MAG: class I SAM-dependent methyltransferase [Nanoarchaeota archaeon]
MINKKTISFYELIDSWVGEGIEDFTEGIYSRYSKLDYFKAQNNQHNYLLDQIKCVDGAKILDIGCGNGNLLKVAKKRGAIAEGITISPIQVKRCKEKCLKVEFMDYKDIGKEWNGKYSGVVANGSMEHFVSPQEALEGKQDEIYRNMFLIVKNILKPGGRFVTTTIHFKIKPEPENVMKNALLHKWGSDDFHFSFVLDNLGCYYPSKGQLERCAKGLFKLEKEVDGTEDYRITSEYWLNKLWPRCLISSNFWKSLFFKTIKNPKHSISSLFQYVITQSWNWQFRPDENGKTPTRLLRQTWKRI